MTCELQTDSCPSMRASARPTGKTWLPTSTGTPGYMDDQSSRATRQCYTKAAEVGLYQDRSTSALLATGQSRCIDNLRTRNTWNSTCIDSETRPHRARPATKPQIGMSRAHCLRMAQFVSAAPASLQAPGHHPRCHRVPAGPSDTTVGLAERSFFASTAALCPEAPCGSATVLPRPPLTAAEQRSIGAGGPKMRVSCRECGSLTCSGASASGTSVGRTQQRTHEMVCCALGCKWRWYPPGLAGSGTLPHWAVLCGLWEWWSPTALLCAERQWLKRSLSVSSQARGAPLHA